MRARNAWLNSYAASATILTLRISGANLRGSLLRLVRKN
jgi:hypothetical protein